MKEIDANGDGEISLAEAGADTYEQFSEAAKECKHAKEEVAELRTEASKSWH